MNPYLRHLDRMEFVVTLACTGRCKHCSQGEHTARGERLDGSLAARAILKVCSRFRIQSLMTFGGEPLLCPETVCQIHEAGRQGGVPRRSVITNGFFSRSREEIGETVRALARSGVNELLLSVDAFHQESIPLEPVEEFAARVLEEKIPIRTHPAWLIGPEDENPWDQRTQEILQRFQRRGIDPSGGNRVFPSGNAKKYLQEYWTHRVSPPDPYEEPPDDIRTLCVSPDGSVLHGNLCEQGILDILDTYRPG